MSNSGGRVLLGAKMKDTSFGTYRELAVWQKSVLLVKLVYAQVRHLPVGEKYALADQLRRSVMSIPANIAEGNGRLSNRDYAHFLSIARGSLYETISHLDVAESLGYIDHSDEIESIAIELRKMLFAMINKFSSVPPST